MRWLFAHQFFIKMEEAKHHWPKEKCYYCGEPASCYCDAVSHFLVDSKMMIKTGDPNVVGYCDRPICDEHSKVVGMSTASGRVDTVDYCTKHVTMQKLNESPKLVCK